MKKITLEQFKTKCENVATLLGGSFTCDSAFESWIFQGEIALKGAVVNVSCDSTVGKLNFSAEWPKNVKNEVFSPRSYDKSSYTSISCTASRPAKAIANDVERRFLPAYLLELGVQKVRCASSDDYAARTEANAAKFARISEGKRYEHRANEVSLSGVRSDIYGNVKVSGDNVAIELHSLSPAQAEAVLKLFVTL